MEVEDGYCIQAVGNLYGFPPAGQNFSIEFDKCVMEMGYVNTPWDLKLFYKWINDKPIFVIAHSDDCQCKISLPTQVYMLVYEYLGYRH